MGKGKMKRLLAVLLCVTQLIGFVPHAHADEVATPGEATPCEHPEVALVQTGGTQKNKTVSNITADKHTREFDVYWIYDCTDCQTTGIEKYIERGYETESHRYNDGVCYVCDYVCLHASYKDGSCVACGTPCASHDLNGGSCGNCGMVCPHESYVGGECEDCGEPCPNHDLSSGSCGECGKECLHESYVGGECEVCGEPCPNHDLSSGSCGSCGMVCPHESYANGVCTVCSNPCASHDLNGGSCAACGEKCPHANYADGKCAACGTECTHANGGTYVDYRMDFGTPVYKNADFHVMPYTVTDIYECSTCSQRYDGDVDEMEGDEGHNFGADGKCACGAEGAATTCEHQNTEERYYDANVSYSGISDAGHTKTADVYYYIWCLDCETRRMQQLDYPGKVTTEAHSFTSGACACGYTCAHGSYEDGKCAVCGADCQHQHQAPERDEYDEIVVYDRVNGAAEQQNREVNPGYFEVHFRHFTGKTKMVCTVCGAYVGDGTVNGKESELHSWADGVCSACGYVCEHNPDTTVGDTYAKKTYTINENNTHTETEETFQDFKCVICADTYSVIQGGGALTVKHTYDMTGLCVCGKQIEICQGEHETLDSGTRHMNVSAYTSNNDGTHSYTADLQKYYKCWSCGLEWSDPVQTGVSLTEKCYFENGVCACGYVNACTHPEDSIFRGTDYWQVSGANWTDNGDGTHYAESYAYHYWYCDACGEDKSTEEGPAVHYVKHTFTGGKCEACGAANTCTHPENSIERWTGYEPVDGVNWTDNGDGTHYANAYKHEGWDCEVCGEYNDTREETPKVYYQRHFFEDGECTLCGAVNTCAHENTKEWEHRRNGDNFATVDAINHKFTADVYKIVWCNDCETELSETLVGAGVEILATHYFENGVCDECGYKSLCDHSKVEEIEWYNLIEEGTPVDDKTHTGLFYHSIDKWCLLCSEYLGETVISENEQYSEPHYYFDGVCSGCGYVNTCTHESTYEMVWNSDEKNPTYIDEYTHSLNVTEYTEVYCSECLEEMVEKRSSKENVTITEDHRLNASGICVYCEKPGKACAHEELEIMDYDHKVSETKPYDGVSCFWVVDVYKETWCMNCNQQLDEELISAGELRYEEHSSDDGDLICDLCGYQMSDSTETEAPTEAPTATPAPTQVPADDDDDDYFVPTPRPNNNNNYRPAATAVPTAEPTPVPTAEPTAEPTIEPTAAPVETPVSGETEMVTTLIQTLTAVETEGTTVTVEIVGAQEVFTVEEHEQLKQLPAAEQVLVTLSKIGFGEVVEAAMTSMNVTLSENATQLVAQANETLANMTETERQEMQKAIEKNFPKTQVQIDGVVYDYFILEMEIVVDGVARIESYGFRYDETLGQWIFVKMDTLTEDSAA